MPSAIVHRTGAAAIVGAYLMAREAQEGKSTLAPLGGSLLAAVCATVPDILEPAIHPHHRQGFHSVTMATLVGGAIYALKQWQPETEGEKLLRSCLLIAAWAYLIHLAMDACTKRSLPLFGK